ncbi:MAG: DUF1801 domain-containing protein [Acidobacteria bacterium]|nr:DUF1801 domain-containing protein [Acidobacteriota bacterium]
MIVTHSDYFAALTEPRKTELETLDALIRKRGPRLERFIQNGFLGYGRWRYKPDADWFHLGLASNKNYISLYVCTSDAKGMIAEQYRERLPKASIGKSCVRFKRLGDVDLKVIDELIRAGVRAIRET